MANEGGAEWGAMLVVSFAFSEAQGLKHLLALFDEDSVLIQWEVCSLGFLKCPIIRKIPFPNVFSSL